MKGKALFYVAGLILCLACLGCTKEEQSPLVGTVWECAEEGDIIAFKDNQTGLYYCKSATNGVYDDFFSSFDFVYSISGDSITVKVQFTKRVFVLEGTINDDVMTCGIWHFFKIKHKVPVQS